MAFPKRIGCLLVLVPVGAAMLVAPGVALAGGVVGNGTRASCTEAALEAALAGGGNITFNCGTRPFTITVTTTKTITADTNLDGGGLLTLDGGGKVPILDIRAIDCEEPAGCVTVSLRNATFSNGNNSVVGGAVTTYDAQLSVFNCTFSHNTATQGGGAISNSGTLTVTNSTFSHNTAHADDDVSFGGAIYYFGTLTVTNSTFVGNSGDDGGAIYQDGGGSLMVSNSRFSSNASFRGGAIFGQNDRGYGPTTVTDSTFSGNTAETGGAIFIASSEGPTMVTNSTFSGNVAGNEGNYLGGSGGAIYCASTTLAVANSIFSGNVASYGTYDAGGGAIYIDESDILTVTNSTFSHNRVNLVDVGDVGGGGAIFSNFSDQLTVTDSTFSSNTVDSSEIDSPLSGHAGGAIAAVSGYRGGLNVSNSTFLLNYVNGGGEGGGALYVADKPATVTNSTFYLNGVSYEANGGAIAVDFNSLLTATNSTFYRNNAGRTGNGGAIALENRRGGYWSAGEAILRNTIVADSTRGANCAGGTIIDGGHNLDDGASCGFRPATGSLNNTNPLLDPARLANNGGPTQTIALQAGSPAINAGDKSICSAPPVNNLDQRGFIRPGVGASSCSIGAYEYDSIAPTAAPTDTPTATPTDTPTATTADTPTATDTPAATNTSIPTMTPTMTPTATTSASTPTQTRTAASCAGDCDGSGAVTVNEIITLVNMALGNTDPSACPHGPPSASDVTIALIIQAVNSVLYGCG